MLLDWPTASCVVPLTARGSQSTPWTRTRRVRAPCTSPPAAAPPSRQSGPGSARGRLEQLEAQNVVERARHRIGPQPGFQGRAHYSCRTAEAAGSAAGRVRNPLWRLTSSRTSSARSSNSCSSRARATTSVRHARPARATVRELAPTRWSIWPPERPGVEEDWRGQLADYVLGQQAGPGSRPRAGTCAVRGPLGSGPDPCRLARAALPKRRHARIPAGDVGARGPRPPMGGVSA